MLGFKLNRVSKGGFWQIPCKNLWFFPSVMVWFRLIVSWSMPWFNIKISSYQYRKSYCRDKTVIRSSYLHNGISYTGKMASLYWTNLPESTTMTCQIEEVVVCCLSESNPINLCHSRNSLCAKFFREKINIFTFYAISPHWYDTGCWNTSSNTWHSILMCNKSTSAGTSLEDTPMFAHVTLHHTFNPLGSKCPGGKMRKQLLKDHNFLNNSPIFIIESSTLNIFAFQIALHKIHFNLKSCFGFGERYLTP